MTNIPTLRRRPGMSFIRVSACLWLLVATICPARVAAQNPPAADALDRLNQAIDALTRTVWPGGPAEAGGLKIGDILVSVDGQPAENVPTVNDNFRLRDSSDPVQLVVLRGTTEMPIRVNAVEEKSDLDSVSAMADPRNNLVSELGILGVEIDPRIAAGAEGLRDALGQQAVGSACRPESTSANGRTLPVSRGQERCS